MYQMAQTLVKNIIELSISCSQDIEKNSFNLDKIKIDNGVLTNFSGSEKEFKVLAIAYEGQKCTVSVLPNVFTIGVNGNLESNQFVWTRARQSVKRKIDKDKNRMVSKILKSKQDPQLNIFDSLQKLLY